MRFTFRFRPVPFIATVLLVVLGIALGNWQERRAFQKMAIAQRLAERGAQAPIVLGPKLTPAASLEFRHVTITGQFDTAWPIFLANKTYQGRPGSYLVMPFKIAGSDMRVLVARGWLPSDPAHYDKPPGYPTPSGTVTIEGMVTGSLGRAMQLGTPPVLRPNVFVQNLEPGGFAQASGMPVQPFFVEQTGPKLEGEPFVREWPAPAMGIEKHQGYAFQWYALAVMAFLFFVITGFRSGAKHDG